MKQGLLAKEKPLFQIFIAFIVIFLSFSILFAVAVIIAIPLYDLPVENILDAIAQYEKPGNMSIIRYFQIAQSIGLFVIPPFILGYLFYRNAPRYLLMNRIPAIEVVGTLILLLIASAPLINFLAEINEKLNLPETWSGIERWMKQSEESAKRITELFLKGNTLGDLMINLFMVAIIPAIGEELIFRGVFQRLFSDLTRNKHAGIIISAILFSAFHLQFYGFLPRLMLGVYFGYMLLWSKNIWYPIIAHFINNATAVTIYFFADGNAFQEEIEQVGRTDHYLYFMPLSVILVGFLLWLLHKQLNRE